ncbi:hypothetical protein Ate01nite_47400 [Actinoplanes teichomyceticus]|nr:hypothetical protein Ate01nite_47400 [Actinoplanes teichomyceticus]
MHGAPQVRAGPGAADQVQDLGHVRGGQHGRRRVRLGAQRDVDHLYAGSAAGRQPAGWLVPGQPGQDHLGVPRDERGQVAPGPRVLRGAERVERRHVAVVARRPAVDLGERRVRAGQRVPGRVVQDLVEADVGGHLPSIGRPGGLISDFSTASPVRFQRCRMRA